MKNFEFLVPESAKQACSYLSQYQEDARVIAGGQSLMILLKHGLIKPSCLIDLKALSNLEYLTFDEKYGLRMGALVTHRTVETSPLIKKHYEVLSHMEQTLANLQIRNYGTVGGNLCHADPSSDLIPPLMALGASVKLTSPRGERAIPLEAFFVDYYESILDVDEILTEIQVPPMAPHSIARYRKMSYRKTDSAMVGGAAWILLDPGKKIGEDVKLVLSSAGPVPLRVKRAEEMMKGEEITPALIDEISRIASEEASPTPDLHASYEYKCEMIRVLVKRLFKDMMETLEWKR